MSYHLDDTIAAIATAAGGAARGLIRVSGPDAITAVGRCFEFKGDSTLNPQRRAQVLSGCVRIARPFPPPGPSDPGAQFLVVPCDLFVWPTNRSYTREPVVELHTVGSPPLLEAVLEEVCSSGARLAEPGEFTLRAFLAGRIDLTQAEAVLGVIDARGSEELRASLAQLAGGLAHPLHQLRDQLLQLLAELEANLDFVEEDIRFVSAAEMTARLQEAIEQLTNVTGQMESRLAPAMAERIALIGPPNVGKSSLFNALVVADCERQEARGHSSQAIVSAYAGTTRDYLTAQISLNGICCELVDTAGVDDGSNGLIETTAQELSVQLRNRSTIRVWCTDAMEIEEWPADCNLLVLTKDDLVHRPPRLRCAEPNEAAAVVTSSQTGAGLEELRRGLGALLSRGLSRDRSQVVAVTAARARESARLALASLERAAELVDCGEGEELVAAELRGAISELGKVVGAVYTDDLLDRIFSTFCVGK